ncbi:MAG: hypothetical protein OFPI_15610 [Osedax symbiont Rs2]|nr:MAG: hypothetical protein OFPI_15610 [Osedax symbiont Rs2]
MPTTRHFSLLHPYLKNLLLLILLCSALRVLFFALNYQQFQTLSNSTLGLAFLHGLRFDLATVTLCLAPWLLLSLLFYIFNWQRALRLFGKIYWPLPPLLIIATNVADTLYFPFTGRRSGPEVLSFSQDLADQAGQLLGQYWLLATLSVISVFLFIAASLSLLPKISPVSRPWYSRLAIAVGIFFFAAVSIRSGFGSKPLSPSHAFNWPAASTGHLVLNSTFTLLRQDLSKLDKIDFFATDKQARQLNQRQSAPWPTPANRDNVVIIVLESFSLEYISTNRDSAGYAPFLQHLMKQSLYFTDAYANGRRSIDALPAVLAGLPTLMQEAFITSGYLGNKVSGLAQVLRLEDYQSWFFHGAKNGSMHIDTMSKRFGFENYTGRNEYPDQSDFDGKWGIYDEPFLQHMASTLDTLQQPFVAGVFTISSHNPYSIPAQYEGDFPKGTLKIHPTIGYTDMALRKFFASAKKMPWYDNTLFVITADHTSLSDNPDFQTATGRHRVPILLYSPNGKISPGDSNKVAQHTDLPITVLDYLGLSEKYRDQLLPFGHSLLAETAGEAFFVESDQYVLINQSATLLASKDFQQLEFKPNASSDSQIDATQSQMLKRLKAKVQIYNNGMINNDLIR